MSGPFEANIYDTGVRTAHSPPGSGVLAPNRPHSEITGREVTLNAAPYSPSFSFPGSSGSLPEANFEKDRKKKSWFRRNIADLVKKVVQGVDG